MINLPGVLPGSISYFNSPSSLAKSHLFHTVSAGAFDCDNNYSTIRDKFNSFLLMHVGSGTGGLEFRGRTYRLQTGDTVLINCYEPHKYYTREGWSILWMHFDGLSTPGIFELLHQRTGCLMPPDCAPMTRRKLTIILHALEGRRRISEPRMSLMIHGILSSFLEAASTLSAGSHRYTSAAVTRALNFIDEGFTGEISLSDIADKANLSQFHLSRLFKQETGYSPYDYVIKCRIDHSKRLLSTTPMSVREVAYASGFCNESAYVSVFRKRTGMTPASFRKAFDVG